MMRSIIVTGDPVTSLNENYDDYINELEEKAREIMEKKKPLKGPTGLSITFNLTKPTSNKKNEYWACRMPDIDNLCKAILDALEGIIYENDLQVCSLHADKQYNLDDSPFTKIRFWRL